MSLRERPKKGKSDKKDSSKESIDDWLDNVPLEEQNKQSTLSEQESNERINEKIDDPKKDIIETSTQGIETNLEESLYDIFVNELPSWVTRPWMFVLPTHETHLSSWIESWKNLILDYSRILQSHVINLTEMQTIYPFENSKINKQILLPHFTLIVDHMVEHGLAKWLDDSRILVRIYYKTNDQWSEIIIKYLFETGYAAEVLTFYEIEKMGQEWSSLPRIELREIFEILVKKGRAVWVGSLYDTISFTI